MPKFTIITPTYNRADYIVETIESIRKQSFTDFEYLIIDDGSTDDTKKIVEPYLDDPRIKYFYHDNMGEAETANRGWNLAQGEYFTQINSDDTVYSDFLEEMNKALDANPEAILAFPDFDFIDKDGKIISTTRGRPWNFLRNLAQYSCEAACAGTVFRKTALGDITSLKRKGYKHINDTEMYWNLALRGDFLHVPKVLATWRQHPGQISRERYKSIPECEDWFEKYFNQPDLPLEVLSIKDKTRKSLYRYYLTLIAQADISASRKKQLAQPWKDALGESTFNFSVLQISDQDLVGNKFNGHDLHLYLRYNHIDARQYVCIKSSMDKTTYVLDNANSESFFYSLVYNRQFADSDVLHFHLMHNTRFNINYLPFVATLKPVVWTLHDPWTLGGHCIYPGDCDKFKVHCRDCQYLHVHFAADADISALEFAQKKFAISRSPVFPVVASAFMQRLVEHSPVWAGKKITVVPFGIDQELFTPAPDMAAVRKNLGISTEGPVIFARTQRNFKGLEILRKALLQLAAVCKFTLLTVGENQLLPDLPEAITHHEYGWITEDIRLVELYQACDIFLMPSEQEAFGMMAIEAMSCGKMVLALDTPTSALPEVINSPRCGLAVPEDSYGTQLCALIQNQAEIQARGQASLDFARMEYSLSAYLKRLMNLYDEAMEAFEPGPDAEIVLAQIRKYAPLYPASPKNGGNLPAIYNERRMMPGGALARESYRKLKNYYTRHGLKMTFWKIGDKLCQRIGWQRH